MGAVKSRSLFITMSVIKDGRYPVMLDRERHLLFSLNILDELQDKAGGYDKLDVFLSGKDLFKNLRWLLTLLINEGAEENEEPLTEQQVGKLIHAGNFVTMQEAIFRAFAKGNNGDEEPDGETEEDPEDEEDDEKNAQSGQEK